MLIDAGNGTCGDRYTAGWRDGGAQFGKYGAEQLGLLMYCRTAPHSAGQSFFFLAVSFEIRTE